ncbi:hypothetical protein FSPOR_5191 [Fusarium sporotrichioides]|uniref:BTB domain-containing protein n=1 Tax=Fusarium sporotrichioides TaxID=5514 RepID=A0A395S8R9_FUSSP|nr:hypothetical protein FSPOR_5191 [Fusarium sporotrichioides]
MEKSLLDMDPDADALFILRRPNLQQVHAVKEHDALQEKENSEPNSTASPPNKRQKKSSTPADVDAIVSLQPYLENGHPNEIEFRVSTKHLCTASPVFSKMLKGNFQESRPNIRGVLEITASDWNTRAVLVGGTWKFRRSVAFKNLAVCADKDLLPMMKRKQPSLGFSVVSVWDIILGIKIPVLSGEEQNAIVCKLEKNLRLDNEGIDASEARLSLDYFIWDPENSLYQATIKHSTDQIEHHYLNSCRSFGAQYD